MLIPGILGFQSLLLLFLLVVCVVIRQKLKNAAARKEEIMRLVATVSEESAKAEVEAANEHTFLPRPYQCAVCFFPTTTRCSQCKAVRYCSGKCQIMHWRQGHKDECRPLTATMQFTEGSEFSGKSSLSKQSETHGTDFEIVGSKETHTGPTMSGSGPELLVEVSPNEIPGSSIADRSGKHLSEGITPDMPRTSMRSKGMQQTASPLTESINLVNSVNGFSHSSKLNNAFNIVDEEVASKIQLPSGEAVTSDAVQPTKLAYRKSITRDALPDMFVTDTYRSKNSTSLSCTGPDSVTNDKEDGSQLHKGKEVRSLSSSSSDDHPCSTSGQHFLTHSKSLLPTKLSNIPNMPQNARNGLKTSMRKVVQQFRASKQSKHSQFGLGYEVTEKYIDKMTFPYELFKRLYSYDEAKLYPFGLTNVGNSCYANAVLQCLAFTRPLTSYLVQGLHSKGCRKKDWCFFCEFECLILKAREGESPLSPFRILSKIQIGSHLSHGREEDAHEFLRYAVDAMQSVCLKETGARGPLAEETTLVGLTFGGYLRSKIKCMNCLGKSERYERMMDLTVEIDGDIGTLEDALSQFTTSEVLDGENRYHCSRCKSYEKAKKKLTVLEAPNILTIVLKRFKSGNFGKLNKSVRFPEILDMAPYISGTTDTAPVYSLYAVVVHLDIMNAAFSGHYVCYVKNFQGEWFRIDDSTVIPVEVATVLLEGAYMLLYARYSPRVPSSVRNNMGPNIVRPKRRNQEAVPSGVNTSKARDGSSIPRTDSSKVQRKHSKYRYWMTEDGSTKSELDPVDWRFYSMQRTNNVDSSSESSSLFSSSDASSCSSSSTRDSSRSKDLSDYIFGEVGSGWSSPYGLSLDSHQYPAYPTFDADSEPENDVWSPTTGNGWR